MKYRLILTFFLLVVAGSVQAAEFKVMTLTPTKITKETVELLPFLKREIRGWASALSVATHPDVLVGEFDMPKTDKKYVVVMRQDKRSCDDHGCKTTIYQRNYVGSFNLAFEVQAKQPLGLALCDDDAVIALPPGSGRSRDKISAWRIGSMGRGFFLGQFDKTDDIKICKEK
jgi:hypothetical protein